VHHSELTDPQLARLGEVLANLGSGRSFTATEALTAALQAGIVNNLADIDSALSDLEDAGVIREVQKNPPRWQVIEQSSVAKRRAWDRPRRWFRRG
jgi:hypothetical protein